MLHRRRALALLGSGMVGGACAPALASDGGTIRFVHGVASGDPAADGAVLWTRATPLAGDNRAARLAWKVALEGSDGIVREGRVRTGPNRDFTAKVEVVGLRPGTAYRFWFEGPGGIRSPQGKFRTLPLGPTERLDFAVACCQLYQAGWFNALGMIARLERLDAVIHLGDYIYEYGPDYPVYGSAVVGRVPDPPHEAVTLADYRARHAQAKLDPDLQAAHARAAFICVWDDHEVANNAWAGGAANHQPQNEGSWRSRKAAALRAWSEWMPVREPADSSRPEAAFRSFEFGDLASLCMLETRLFARARLPEKLRQAQSLADLQAGLAELREPGRELLGAAQSNWLAAELQRSRRAGQPWQLIGSQVLMAQVGGPDLEKQFGTAKFDRFVAKLDASLRKELLTKLAAFKLGVPFNWESWDGFPDARVRLYELFRAVGVQPMVLSGDSHAFWANNLTAQDGRLAARELGVSAISSASYGDALPQLPLGPLLAQANRDVLFSDQTAKGFLHLTLTHDAARARMIGPVSVKQQDQTARTVAEFACVPSGVLEQVT